MRHNWMKDAIWHMALKAIEARLIAEEARLESLCIISSSVFAGHCIPHDLEILSDWLSSPSSCQRCISGHDD